MNWLDRFVNWVYPEPKPEEPRINVELEWLKMQAEREDRRDDWNRKFKQQQIDSDYWWAYVEMRRDDELELVRALSSVRAKSSRYFGLFDTGYNWGLLISPPYSVVHESAKYKGGGVNIHKQYEEWMESLRPNSTWDWIDYLRKRLKDEMDKPGR